MIVLKKESPRTMKRFRIWPTNDSLDETAGEISEKDRTAMSTRMKRCQGVKIRGDHYPEEISYGKRKSHFRIENATHCETGKIG